MAYARTLSLQRLTSLADVSTAPPAPPGRPGDSPEWSSPEWKLPLSQVELEWELGTRRPITNDNNNNNNNSDRSARR